MTTSEFPLDRAEIETYPDQGVERCLAWLPSVVEAALVQELDTMASFAEELRDV